MPGILVLLSHLPVGALDLGGHEAVEAERAALGVVLVATHARGTRGEPRRGILAVGHRQRSEGVNVNHYKQVEAIFDRSQFHANCLSFELNFTLTTLPLAERAPFQNLKLNGAELPEYVRRLRTAEFY